MLTTFLTGTHLVDVVLRYGRSPVAELVVLRRGSRKGLARLVTEAQQRGVGVRWVSREEMTDLTGSDSTDVAAALADREELSLDDVLPASGAAVTALVVEGVEDPHNLGDILRTAWAAGVGFVVLEAHAAGLPRDVLARSSAGASECLPVVFSDDLAATLDALNDRSVETIAAAPEAEEEVFTATLSERIALIIGGERRGLSSHVLSACSRAVCVPAAGTVQSLSAVSSAAVMLFEIVRRRRGVRG